MTKSKKTVKSTKQPGKPGKPEKQPVITNGYDTFIIEESPPSYIRGLTEVKKALLDKVDRTLLAVKYGQAFIIPTVHRNTIKKYLKDTYGATDKYTYLKVHGNPDTIRVYRFTHDKKKKT